MANPEHLAKLKEGVQVWNLWRKQNPSVKPDLIRADLSGADLHGSDLRKAELWAANLIGASLRRADLTGAHLNEASLDAAVLIEARLIEADLSEATLADANLSDADLKGADLSGAHLLNTVLANLDLNQTKGLENCLHLSPSILDHQTLAKSGRLPLSFLRGCGLPDAFIDYLPSLFNQAIEFYSCFISYNHADKAFARHLHDTLQGRGIRCWLDEKQMLPGDDIHERGHPATPVRPVKMGPCPLRRHRTVTGSIIFFRVVIWKASRYLPKKSDCTPLTSNSKDGLKPAPAL